MDAELSSTTSIESSMKVKTVWIGQSHGIEKSCD